MALPLAVQASSDPFFDDIPLVLTATRLAQSPLDAPAAVTVIDREMIEASGFTRIHDLLRLVPGYLVSDIADSSPSVASHGLGDAYDRRIKVMIDGRTINSPLWGDTKWDNLPLRIDDIERLEVVRGPNGAAYGVNAYQGVINIITRAPETESGKAVILRAGKDGFYDHGFRINSAGEGALDWRLSASRRSAINFEPHLEDKSWFRRLHGGEKLTRNVANFSATLHATSTDKFGLQVGFSEGPSWRGGVEYDDFPPHVERDRALYLQGGWERQVDFDTLLSVKYYHQSEWARGSWPVKQSGETFTADRKSEVRRDDLEAQYATRLGARLTGMLGLGVRAERARSFSLFGQRDWLDATHGQLFGSLDWQATDALRINVGGTLEEHDYSGRLFSPRVAVNYALTPESALRLSAGRAYRAPSLMESSAFQTYRDGDSIRRILFRTLDPLQSERMRFVDLGYVVRVPSLGITLDARVFRQYHERFLDDRSCRPFPSGFDPYAVEDKIKRAEVLEWWKSRCRTEEPDNFAPLDPGRLKAFYFLNGNDFRLTGTEFSIDWRRPGWGRIILSQSFVQIDKGEPYSDPDIPESAPHSTTSVLLIKELPERWRVSMGYYHNGAYMWMNGGNDIPRLDRFDLKLAKRFGAPGSENEFSITALSVKGKYPDFHNGKYRHQPFLFATLRLGW
ncbi:TonB-dependent receptor plug domain-containing protein [Thauera mechernichensis]